MIYVMELLCRICVQITIKDDLKPILSQSKDFIKKLKTFVNFEDHKDASHICHTCSHELDIAFDFVNKCATASKKLDIYNLNKDNYEIIGIDHNIKVLRQDDFIFDSDNVEVLIKEENYLDTDGNILAEVVPEHNLKESVTNIKPKTQNAKDLNIVQASDIKYKSKNKEVLNGHCESVYKKSFKCEQCSQEFKHQDSLKSHQQSHNLFICSVCPRQFSTKNRLMRHARSHNDDKYSFKCNICTKKFTVACNLARHMMIHDGKKPFICETCGKSFSQKVVLQTHMKTHDRLNEAIENNLTDGTVCKLCKCSFENTKCLFSHLTRYHGKSYNKKMLVKCYQCDECGKCLRGYKTWRLHQGTHSGIKPFPCDICGKTFRLRELLKRHNRVHTGEKPYECILCPMRFGAHANLIKHVRKHTGDKPFTCEHCGMSFTSSFNMKRHAARHGLNITVQNTIIL